MATTATFTGGATAAGLGLTGATAAVTGGRLAGTLAGLTTTLGVGAAGLVAGLATGLDTGLTGAGLAIALAGTGFLATGCLASGFLAAGFLAMTFFATGFLGAGLAAFFTAGLPAVLATGLATFFATGLACLPATGFFATGFFTAGFFTAGFVAADFFATTFFAAALALVGAAARATGLPLAVLAEVELRVGFAIFLHHFLPWRPGVIAHEPCTGNPPSGILAPFWRRVAAAPVNILTRFLLLLLKGYKRGISPLLGKHCRFYPSCSDYARIAITRFGPWRGCLLTGWRLLRCQPLCDGGNDPVPEQFHFVRCRCHGDPH